MNILALFVYLQILDGLTTILFLRMGLPETGWVASVLVRWSPLAGVLLVKAAAIAVGVLAVRLHKDRVIRLANIGYSGVVAWNLLCMIVAKTV